MGVVFGYVLVLLCLITSTFSAVPVAPVAPVLQLKQWWETASFYQIYTRSFKDSDGDGVGDLNGVTQSLPYLKEIGVKAAWLSPFLESPMADFGYDISDFYDIDPLFGTMEDFDKLIQKSKEVGVRIILDFVPNHSSDECEWFIKSAARDPRYVNYYVWHPGKIVKGVRRPPNNWVSVYRGSAWEWHEVRQEYYLHQFDKKEPDFNFRNPRVREEIKKILLFWLKKGVDGFRVDAMKHAVEAAPDIYGNYPDEPRNVWNNNPDDYDYVDHIYTTDQPENLELVYEWRSVLDKFQKDNGGDARILMTEAYSPVDVVMQYFGNRTVQGAETPLNFQLMEYLWKDADAYHYAELINNWLKWLPKGRTSNWIIGNNDRSRVGTRFGADRIDMFNMLLLTLPGNSITYYGEEIGMTDVSIPWNKAADPQAIKGPREVYELRSRDPMRTPFQWSSGPNAGFSDGPETWLPVAANYKVVNVKRERASRLSHLNIFKQLQDLRNESYFQYGDTLVRAVNKNVLGIKRSLPDRVYITLLNIFDHTENFNLSAVVGDLAVNFTYEYVVVNDKSLREKGDRITSEIIELMPKESIVILSKSSALICNILFVVFVLSITFVL